MATPMETILVKIFATALQLSKVNTTPEAEKTQFDRIRDQEQVAQLLHAGCTHMRKAFDIEDVNLEELIATALDDPQAVGENKAFHGINFANLQMAIGSSARMRRPWCLRSISATLSISTTRQPPICLITVSAELEQQQWLLM